jgi:hypothetical protein
MADSVGAYAHPPTHVLGIQAAFLNVAFTKQAGMLGRHVFKLFFPTHKLLDQI